MPAGAPGNRLYPVRGQREPSAPDYGRVVRGLTFEDLVGELAGCRGKVGYRRAVAAEIDRRLCQEDDDG